MKNDKIRIIALTLSAILVATCAVGCGNVNGNPAVGGDIGINEKEAESTINCDMEIEESSEERAQVVTTDYDRLSEAFRAIDIIVSNDVENGFTSAQVAVMKDGELLYSEAFGKINSYDSNGDRTDSAPDATTDTLYDLASNTKMYSVAYAIQYLVTRGDLNLDDRVTDILGDDFAEATVLPEGFKTTASGLEQIKEWKRGLRVRDVMCHRAGFVPSPSYLFKYYDYGGDSYDTDLSNPLFAGYDGSIETRSMTLQKIFESPLEYEPCTRVSYSDTDYMLLCFLVEKITGKGLDEYLRETFWNPMGLEHITYNPLENGFGRDDCAATELKGNTRDGFVTFEGVRTEPLQGTVHDEKAYAVMAGVSGHAGLFANAEDLARLAWLMVDGTYGGEEFFSEDVLETFTTCDDENHMDWGIGWWREAGWICSAANISLTWLPRIRWDIRAGQAR